MAELPSSIVVFAVPAVAGLIYAVIWYATRNMSRFAKVVARVIPFVMIVWAVLYLSLSPVLRHEAQPTSGLDETAPAGG